MTQCEAQAPILKGGYELLEQTELKQLTQYCARHLDLANATFADEYRYASLPLCVIDAVWSIGVRYGGVENVITRFCEVLNISRVRPDSETLPPTEQQFSISDFIRLYEEQDLEHIVNTLYDNRQRTSSKNGILKAEAVYRFAMVLQQFNVNYLQDVGKILGNAAFEAAIKQIPGQRSGISLNYFYMLIGSREHVKPNRQISRFITAAIGRVPSVDEMPSMLMGACEQLKADYPHLNPRLLDHMIWLYQTGQE